MKEEDSLDEYSKKVEDSENIFLEAICHVIMENISTVFRTNIVPA